MRRELLQIPGSLAAMVGTMISGVHVVDVKLADHQAVSAIWKEDVNIGKQLKTANEHTLPVYKEERFGGRKHVESVEMPDLKALKESLTKAKNEIEKTGRAEPLKQDVERIIAGVQQGVTIGDQSGRYVDGLSGVRNRINTVSEQFGEEEGRMNRRKWWDRVLIGLGAVAVVGAPAAETAWFLRLNKKARDVSGKGKSSNQENTAADPFVPADEIDERIPGWMARKWKSATTLPSQKQPADAKQQ